MKLSALAIALSLAGRSPRGERGLKSAKVAEAFARDKRSLPPRGAWIEIPEELEALPLEEVAPPAGSVD